MLYDRRYNFTAGETIIADQIDDELNEVRTVLNGNIEANNIKDASITVDKLDASLNPTQRTAETVGDFVISGLELGVLKTLTGVWTNRDETITAGYYYIDGVRVSCAGGSKTFSPSTTTYVILDDTGNLHYETTLSVGYNNLPLYKVTTDGTKITAAEALAWGDIGTVIPFAGTTAPTGYILCQGGEVTKTAYPKLFNVIRNVWGTPSSASVFRVPDLRTRTVHGFGDPSYYTVFGEKGGGYTASHNHNFSHNHYMNHQHSFSTGASRYDGGWGIVSNVAGAWGDHAHDGTTGWTRDWTDDAANGVTAGRGTWTADSAPSILDPYIVMHYIIKAS